MINGFWTQYQHGGWRFPLPNQAILLTPAGCPITQLNSDTWREHQVPQAKGSVPQD